MKASVFSGALRSSGSQAARRQLWRRNTFGSGWNTHRAWFHVFISDRAALKASDWPGMDCKGGTASDPNHVGTEQENGVRRGDSNSGPRVYTVIGECVLRLGALEHRPGCRNSPTLDYSIWKNPAGPSGAPLSEVLAFGSLGRGLLWFLPTSCSHRRGAGFSFTASLCRRRRRRNLAPRPAEEGETRRKCQPVYLACHVEGAVQKCAFKELLMGSAAATPLIHVSTRKRMSESPKRLP